MNGVSKDRRFGVCLKLLEGKPTIQLPLPLPYKQDLLIPSKTWEMNFILLLLKWQIVYMHKWMFFIFIYQGRKTFPWDQQQFGGKFFTCDLVIEKATAGCVKTHCIDGITCKLWRCPRSYWWHWHVMICSVNLPIQIRNETPELKRGVAKAVFDLYDVVTHDLLPSNLR